jgi:hypothetical protein
VDTGISIIKMKNHILEIERELQTTKNTLLNDSVLQNDVDFKFDFLLPYSKADSISQVKLVIIGQDPTIQDKTEVSKKRQQEITITLDLNNENGNLRNYCTLISNSLGFNIDKNVYATNLCKCIFKEKPAYNGVLSKHSKQWLTLLKKELSVFSEKVVFITLGEPLLIQLTPSNSKKVNYYWDYIGQTKSGGNFKCNEAHENYIHRRIYPVGHQPTWSRNKFYKIYMEDYLNFIKNNEK